MSSFQIIVGSMLKELLLLSTMLTISPIVIRAIVTNQNLLSRVFNIYINA